MEAKDEIKGGRKLRESRESAWFLLVGFIVAAWLKVSAELYAAFALGVAGKSAGFMWGNSKEHQATAAKEVQGGKSNS